MLSRNSFQISVEVFELKGVSLKQTLATCFFIEIWPRGILCSAISMHA